MARKAEPGSERSEAARLEQALGRRITKDCVRAWRAKGWDLTDISGLEHHLRQQTRQPKKLTETQPPDRARPPQSPPVSAGDPAAALTNLQLDQRLADLERDLLAAPDYETGRSIRIKISGYRELVRIQTDRKFLVDRATVEKHAHEVGMLIRANLLQLPGSLIPQILGLDYPEAFEFAENYVYAILTDLSEIGKFHIVPHSEDVACRVDRDPLLSP